jgi:hypothetical protein
MASTLSWSGYVTGMLGDKKYINNFVKETFWEDKRVEMTLNCGQ